MEERIRIDHIGGWPKVIDDPLHPQLMRWYTSIGMDESDIAARTNAIYSGPDHGPSDRPHNINGQEYRRYRGDENTYAAMNAFVQFVELGLYPPKWALMHLADGFKKHLRNPDPDLVAKQLGITAPGSGRKNPYERYIEREEWGRIFGHFQTLIASFDISLTIAAKAVIAMHDLDLSEKRVIAKWRESNRGGFGGGMERLRDRPREMYPFGSAEFAMRIFEFGSYKKVPRALRLEIIKKAPDFAEEAPKKT